MNLFGLGIPEIILILVIAVIVLGPEVMVTTARSLGRGIRKLIRSPFWSTMVETQREIREMPTRIVREAGLEEDMKEIKRARQDLQSTSLKNELGKFTSQSIIQPIVKAAADPVSPARNPETPVQPETVSRRCAGSRTRFKPGNSPASTAFSSQSRVYAMPLGR